MADLRVAFESLLNKKKGVVYSIISDNLYHIIYYDGSFEFVDSKYIELFTYRKLELQ